jgi:hypothetical protein
MTKQDTAHSLSAVPAESAGAGAPGFIVMTKSGLADAIDAELKEYFVDAFGPTLEQYAVDHLVGGVLLRLKLGSVRSA